MARRGVMAMLFAVCLAAGVAVAVISHVQKNGSPEGAPAPDAAKEEALTANVPSDDDYLWLSVSGKRIMTSPASVGGARSFIPVGIGYARDVIIKAQDEDVMRYAKERGLNTVRLAFYTRFFNNKADRPIDIEAHLSDFCDPVVAAAKKHGLYVILDDHGYFSEKIDEEKARQEQQAKRWDDAGVEEWIRRWTAVADHYKNEPQVLGYELCNEPHDISAETTRDYYTRCLKSIRQVDTRHIVILGNNNWSHARAMETTWGVAASTVDAPYNQVVFSFHDYPTDNHPWIVQKHITAFRDKHNVPVLCTEFGATWWDHGETVCRSFQAGMLGLFAKEDVGWMIWALKQVNDNPRVPHPPTKKEREAAQDGVNYFVKTDGVFKHYDSCAYSDLWPPIAKIMGSPVPVPAQKP